MNDLNKAPFVLLVEARERETHTDVLDFMTKNYARRNNDKKLGPRYKIGPRYTLNGESYYHIQTWAGSLVARVVFDTTKRAFNRTILFRFNDSDEFQRLTPGGQPEPVESRSITEVTGKR